VLERVRQVGAGKQAPRVATASTALPLRRPADGGAPQWCAALRCRPDPCLDRRAGSEWPGPRGSAVCHPPLLPARAGCWWPSSPT
jgi:hypothetical protein